jgi:hypothetical protein
MTTKKAVGTALYIELRKHSNTAQILIVPSLQNPVASQQEPLRLLTRQISSVNPRRAWRFYTSTVRHEALPTESLEVATNAVIGYMKDIEAYIAGFSMGGWEMYQTPLAVEMSTDDLTDISGGNTPNALIRRVLRSRAEAGYEESLIAETPIEVSL